MLGEGLLSLVSIGASVRWWYQQILLERCFWNGCTVGKLFLILLFQDYHVWSKDKCRLFKRLICFALVVALSASDRLEVLCSNGPSSNKKCVSTTKFWHRYWYRVHLQEYFAFAWTRFLRKRNEKLTDRLPDGLLPFFGFFICWNMWICRCDIDLWHTNQELFITGGRYQFLLLILWKSK